MARAALLGLLGLAIGGSFLACGGRAQNELSAASRADGAAGSSSGVASTFGGASTSAGSTGVLVGIAGLPTDGGGSSTAADAGAPSATSSTPPGCPVVTPGAVCPGFSVDLDLTRSTSGTGGVWAEPLQAPEYGTRPAGYYPPSVNRDPASWDRSALPAGACVFRLHGLPPSCLRTGQVKNHACAPDSLANPTYASDYYASGLCQQGVAPGCPTANPWNASGYWWYLLPDGAETDLVMCAPECAESVALDGDVCLTLTGPAE